MSLIPDVDNRATSDNDIVEPAEAKDKDFQPAVKKSRTKVLGCEERLFEDKEP